MATSLTDDGSSIDSLGDVLDEIETTADGASTVRLSDVVDRIGRRSFVPLLLAGGCVMGAPVIGVIPGVPLLSGLCVGLVAVQMVLGRDRLWLPHWIERRQVDASKVRSAIGWLRKPAAWIDDRTKPRMQSLVNGFGRDVMAVACLAIAATSPLMELVPMSANVAGAAIVAVSLSLLVRDGLIGVMALGTLALFTGLMGYHLLA